MNIEITCKTLKEISYVFEQCKKFCLINFNLIVINSSLTFNSVTKKICHGCGVQGANKCQQVLNYLININIYLLPNSIIKIYY